MSVIDIRDVPPEDRFDAMINTGERDSVPETDRSMHYNPATGVLSVANFTDTENPVWNEHLLGSTSIASFRTTGSVSISGTDPTVTVTWMGSSTYDDLGMELGSPGTVLTIPETGRYQVNVYLVLAVDDGYSRAVANLRNNNTGFLADRLQVGYITGPNGYYMHLQMENVFAADDDIDLQVTLVGTNSGGGNSAQAVIWFNKTG